MDFIKLASERYSLKNTMGEGFLRTSLISFRGRPSFSNCQKFTKLQDLCGRVWRSFGQGWPGDSLSLWCGDSPCFNLWYRPSFHLSRRQIWLWFWRYSHVATHIILAAKSLGVDSCWINNIDPDQVKEVFDLPANEIVVCMIDLGFPAEGAGPLANHTNRKPIEDLVKYI